MGYALSVRTAELYDEFLAFERPRLSIHGIENLQVYVRRMLAWFDAEAIDPLSMGIQDAVRYQAWLSERRDGDGVLYSTGTMHNNIKAVRRFFDHLVRTERLTANPFRELRYPRLPDHMSRNVLSEAQMGQLLRELAKFDERATVNDRARRYRAHVIAEFLYATGLRIAEACSLAERDLDLERRLVFLRAGKGGKPRTAFLTSYAAEVMERYLKTGRAAIMRLHARPVGGGALFASVEECVVKAINGELRAVCAELGLPAITSHGFRHSLGTHLLRSGCDMRHIQAILGHESLGTTQVYTHVDKDDLKRSLDEFHPRKWNMRDDHGN